MDGEQKVRDEENYIKYLLRKRLDKGKKEIFKEIFKNIL